MAENVNQMGQPIGFQLPGGLRRRQVPTTSTLSRAASRQIFGVDEEPAPGVGALRADVIPSNPFAMERS